MRRATSARGATDDPLTAFGKEGLSLLRRRPLDAETPAHLLDDAITPTARHFVRNNGLPPETIDADRWRLTVDGRVDRPLQLGIADLRASFEVVTAAAVIECAGNGRAFFRPRTDGNQWTYGGVGCSTWTGVRLRDVLAQAGVQPAAVYTAHYGADADVSGDPDRLPLSRGLPIAKAMDPTVLVAFAQNGAALHPLHGAPLRLVVPGWPGSCSHKWLTRITVREVEHDGPGMTGMSYRLPNRPVAPGEAVADADMKVIHAMPVKSLITHPTDGTLLDRPTVEVRGHAWVGDGSVERVELSLDRGRSWTRADLDAPVDPGAWQNWRLPVTLPHTGSFQLWARATDDRGVAQPLAAPWNPMGYNNNAIQRIGVRLA